MPIPKKKPKAKVVGTNTPKSTWTISEIEETLKNDLSFDGRDLVRSFAREAVDDGEISDDKQFARDEVMKITDSIAEWLEDVAHAVRNHIPEFVE